MCCRSEHPLGTSVWESDDKTPFSFHLDFLEFFLWNVPSWKLTTMLWEAKVTWKSHMKRENNAGHILAVSNIQPGHKWRNHLGRSSPSRHCIEKNPNPRHMTPVKLSLPSPAIFEPSPLRPPDLGSKDKPSFLCPAQTSDPLNEYNEMVVVSCH